MASEVVARTGDEYTYVELKLDFVGDAVSLEADLVVNGRAFSFEDRDTIFSRLIDEGDPEDTWNTAIDTATDAERVADGWLEELRVRGWKDRDFGKAVEMFLDLRSAQAHAHAHAVAAE